MPFRIEWDTAISRREPSYMPRFYPCFAMPIATISACTLVLALIGNYWSVPAPKWYAWLVLATLAWAMIGHFSEFGLRIVSLRPIPPLWTVKWDIAFILSVLWNAVMTLYVVRVAF
jgi:hypothetical protein